ncbi:MAG: bifunctional 23S rRNA (guanine(2069)-N(7))-methyltransferase RlmK/23S rRNA (guanine(2445)-N(2))-methyltransferase RlmL [Deltaproteobacteria bacterium]|nr:bifunctional 23S rRNA (guanine(2069)-N(7))-methyltransferase RlmK/23S rRNA (guanine(2445)-N(2))-methyltransferase RlmL [Deltaproteobacteria bacterium]
MAHIRSFFANCPKSIEGLLREELLGLGAMDVRETRAGVHFRGDLKTAYRICLWSRLTNRVLLSLDAFEARTPDDLYHQVYSRIDWHDHLAVDGTLAVDFNSTGTHAFHSQYAALRVKDAVVDQFNHRFGRRPDVDTRHPHLRINLFMKGQQATVSIDLAGESLHRRGYRTQSGEAPLKENLAAAVLIRAGWPRMTREHSVMLDPMCGSGTLPIEAALMALDIAPAMKRTYFGFLGWKKHDQDIYATLIKEAVQRAESGRTKSGCRFFGFDRDPDAITQAASNASAAGISRIVRFECGPIKDMKPPEASKPGLLITNPPYGERLGEKNALMQLYRTFGERLRAGFNGWKVSVLTANPELAKQMGIRAGKQYRLYNGALPCRLFNFEVHESRYMKTAPPESRALKRKLDPGAGNGADMFQNRLKKNVKRMGKWAGKNGISCYRLYDSDMPEYNVAIDRYEDWIHVQEYQAPGSVSEKDAASRLDQVMTILPDLLEVPQNHIVLKQRQKTRGKMQYEKLDHRGQFHEVHEDGLSFLVNLTDYIDTGLFLNQRNTRKHIRGIASGKRFLNLFCYTATATVYAAAGDALRTTSVDMSGPYLSWAKNNLALNGFDPKQHVLIQADCLEWIEACRERYDLIFLDPPTFSNSKRMSVSFDIQRDHIPLLQRTLHLLSPGGRLIFACNRRNFRLDTESLRAYTIRDTSGITLPKDFERRRNSHHSFEIRASQETSNGH